MIVYSLTGEKATVGGKKPSFGAQPPFFDQNAIEN
jgi:hypothetical protein